ncbi:ABC transporter permease [Aquicoccus sp. G2-2]|jgi:ABC-type polysaccharide/polyol phosphate export permease|uniref:ABC transporter permease n=1 Tax=Aquicoccus sp. G2-2 TaxID=3092120 RepID=UPI002ADF39CB|nr:ABC transporter permease [Aquicoccus sp. G2-2]MEA1114644.1 ABC transporter permease [Aquicoccus sp. G2-2]
MFQVRRNDSMLTSAITMAELIYHSIVRSIRNTHGNALMSIVLNLLNMAIMMAAFYLLFTLLGMRRSAIRGDFLLYIMSGIFLYMTHVRTMGAVSSADGPSSAMMKHAPMNTIIGIFSAAFSALYIQVLSLSVILFGYHVGVTPFDIHDPVGAFAMLLLAWFTGAALGTIMLAVKPWSPTAVNIFGQIYRRANMIASGKMFVANALTEEKLRLFDWNPLFHCIDQARGFVFINYFPRNSSWHYALYVGLVLLMIGLMAEFFTRQHASASWGARR